MGWFPPAAIMLAVQQAHNAPQVNWPSTGSQGKIKSLETKMVKIEA
jgi:hypothetical protein